MNELNVEVLQKKASQFSKMQTFVHVKYHRGFWKRGYITEVSSDFFILKERLEGEMPVFYQEIKDIEKFVKKEVAK